MDVTHTETKAGIGGSSSRGMTELRTKVEVEWASTHPGSPGDGGRLVWLVVDGVAWVVGGMGCNRRP